MAAGAEAADMRGLIVLLLLRGRLLGEASVEVAGGRTGTKPRAVFSSRTRGSRIIGLYVWMHVCSIHMSIDRTVCLRVQCVHCVRR